MAKEKTAVYTFGRMNPPTVGHEKLLRKTIDHANSIGADHHIYVSHSHDTDKNPLAGHEKAGYIKKAMPGANVKTSSKESPSFLTAAKELHAKGYHHLVMVAGSDRVDHYHKLLNSYNGKEGHYNFKSIKVVSAGQRDPDAEGVEGMSGTKMRQAAKSGDKEKFKSGLMTGLADKHKEEIYSKVRSSMGIKEQVAARPIPYLLMTEKQKEAMNGKKPDSEDDYDKDIEGLSWEDIFHLYDDDEVVVDKKLKDELDEEVNEDVLLEGLSIMQRIKKRIDFMKTERRRMVARRVALARSSTLDRLKRRSKVAARKVLEKRFLAGRGKDELSSDEKSKIEKRLRDMGDVQNNLATKLMPKIRDLEKQRLQRKEEVEEVEEIVETKMLTMRDFLDCCPDDQYGIVEEEFEATGQEEYEDWGEESEDVYLVYEGENPQVKGGDPCWSGYQMVGMKKKKGKRVPNCVPVDEDIMGMAFNRPTYKLAKATLQDVIKRKKAEGAKHNVDYYAAKVAASHKGVDARTLAKMVAEEEEKKKVSLNKPFLTPGGPKKRAVYVKNEKGNVVKVSFGDPNLSIKRDDPERRSNFRARHNCDNPGPKTKARYWSCKYWSTKSTTDLDQGK